MEDKKPTVEQLKARAYDLLAMKQRIDGELGAINQAIGEASKAEPEAKPKVDKK